jgi:hypothetical protein
MGGSSQNCGQSNYLLTVLDYTCFMELEYKKVNSSVSGRVTILQMKVKVLENEVSLE